jgi:tetratricopeptide (TPR) repeat protein
MPVASLLLAALAASSDAPVATAAPMTAQQQFDAATAAYSGRHCPEAIALYDLLAARPGLARNAHVQAVIHVRKGACLVRLNRFDEAANELAAALPALPASDPQNSDELFTAHMALGQIAYRAFDFANATHEFEQARAPSVGGDAYEALLWLTRSTMFEPEPVAVSYAEQALALASTDPAMKAIDLAPVHTLHARALLNHGRTTDAYAELKAALKAQGGLTQHVTLEDVVTRSDLALAAMLDHDDSHAREYLAYTGAGRFDDSPFASAASMDLPPCGGPANLVPDDYVVVEFSIDDNGAVTRVSPIYASRGGPAAAEFASAVAGWSWRAQDAKKIPAFFRLVTRIELRCSTSTAHPDVLTQLRPAFADWVTGHVPKAGSYHPTGSESERLESARAEVARLEGSGDALAALPALLHLAYNPIVLPAQRREWLLKARDLLARNGAPVAALTYLDVGLSEAMGRERVSFDQHRTYLRSLLARPEIAADPRSAAALRLLIAESHYDSKAPADAAALLHAVANDAALAQQDPLRVGALVRLASLQAASGDLAAARASFDLSGLSDRQCSLVDATPSARRYGDAPFPQEAQNWGFEGWVIVQFDIQADGQTANQRAVVAYPPLVFQQTAVKVAQGTRYEQTYRPAGGLGCGGQQVKVIFSLHP